MYQSIPAAPIPFPRNYPFLERKWLCPHTRERKTVLKPNHWAKKIGSISPPPGNNIDCLVNLDLHIIIRWTIRNINANYKIEVLQQE
jgi:hypothetical protein